MSLEFSCLDDVVKHLRCDNEYPGNEKKVTWCVNWLKNEIVPKNTSSVAFASNRVQVFLRFLGEVGRVYDNIKSGPFILPAFRKIVKLHRRRYRHMIKNFRTGLNKVWNEVDVSKIVEFPEDQIDYHSPKFQDVLKRNLSGLYSKILQDAFYKKAGSKENENKEGEEEEEKEVEAMSVCEICILFTEICSRLGISNTAISGLLKNDSYFDIRKHCWNRVKFTEDGNWTAVDCVWGEITEDNEKFLLRHYPLGSLFQMVDTPISKEVFISRPIVFDDKARIVSIDEVERPESGIIQVSEGNLCDFTVAALDDCVESVGVSVFRANQKGESSSVEIPRCFHVVSSAPRISTNNGKQKQKQGMEKKKKRKVYLVIVRFPGMGNYNMDVYYESKGWKIKFARLFAVVSSKNETSYDFARFPLPSMSESKKEKNVKLISHLNGDLNVLTGQQLEVKIGAIKGTKINVKLMKRQNGKTGKKKKKARLKEVKTKGLIEIREDPTKVFEKLQVFDTYNMENTILFKPPKVPAVYEMKIFFNDNFDDIPVWYTITVKRSNKEVASIYDIIEDDSDDEDFFQ